jgi:hypothetical protein
MSCSSRTNDTVSGVPGGVVPKATAPGSKETLNPVGTGTYVLGPDGEVLPGPDGEALPGADGEALPGADGEAPAAGAGTKDRLTAAKAPTDRTAQDCGTRNRVFMARRDLLFLFGLLVWLFLFFWRGAADVRRLAGGDGHR